MGTIILFLAAVWAFLVIVAIFAKWWDNLNP